MKKSIRIAGIVAGILFALVAAAGVAGLFCPERVAVEAAIVINKPQAQVFALMTDHERLLREVHSPEIRFTQEGAQRRWKIEGAPGFAVQEDIAYEPPHRFVSRVYDEAGAEVGEWDIRVKPVTARTVPATAGATPRPSEASIVSVDMHLNLGNPFLRLLAATVFDASAEEQKSLEAIKAYIEKQ